MAGTEQSAFWDFTLESYPREGVQQAVIALQDKRGADVNLLFFCCYVAASGRGKLSRDDLAAADAALDPWRRQVTLPLRALRDAIKNTESLWSIPGTPEVRGKVLGAEIDSERIAQGILEGLAPAAPEGERSPAERRADALANLDAYLEVLSIAPDDDDRQALHWLLKGTFPEGAATG